MCNQKNKILILFFCCFIALFSCLLIGCGGDGEEAEDTKYRVMVTASDGVSVTSTNPLEVEPGTSASFALSFADHYVFASATHGSYDSRESILTVENVTSNLTIDVTASYFEGDTSVEYRYFFRGAANDTTTQKNNSVVKAGTSITVEAKDYSRIFRGWYHLDKNELVSRERVYTFRAEDAIAKNGVIDVYPLYTYANTVTYDANGGAVNTETANYKGNTYAKVSAVSDGKIKVTYTISFIEYASSPNAFYHDGTFYREGYILKEYNTKADGSGISYSFGSKVNQFDTESDFTLYCIWAKPDPTLFAYEEYTYSETDAQPSEGKHGFLTSGIVITGYSGAESSVAVPEMIDGKWVIGIAEGAFVDRASMKEMILPRTLQFIKDGAISGCNGLSTMYYPSAVYEASDKILDADTKSALKTLVVGANVAPVFANNEAGSFSVKLGRLLTTKEHNRVVVLGGSSTYQGLGSRYLETLLEGKYTVINFGTTRTTHGALYLEAIGEYLHDGDIVIYAPENSIYMMGDNNLYWKTLRDLECMPNLYRYVDISNYGTVFSAFSDFAKNYIYTRNAQNYEAVMGQVTQTNKYGDETKYDKTDYMKDAYGYKDAYYLTFNNRFKSTQEGDWKDTASQEANKDYTDTSNPTWISADKDPMKSVMNHSIDMAKASGAKVLFGFAPSDATALVDAAKHETWLLMYAGWLGYAYHFDAVLGDALSYIMAHEYFYDCAFHTNDYGRTIRTYRMYLDLCDYLGIENKNAYDVFGTDFEGCAFEEGKDPTNVFGTRYIFTLESYKS